VDEALAFVDQHGPTVSRPAAVLAAEVRKLRARRTVLARRSPVARRLRHWVDSGDLPLGLSEDIRALLESYDALLRHGGATEGPM
jgi:hypothetical protein